MFAAPDLAPPTAVWTGLTGIAPCSLLVSDPPKNLSTVAFNSDLFSASFVGLASKNLRAFELKLWLLSEFPVFDRFIPIGAVPTLELALLSMTILLRSTL